MPSGGTYRHVMSWSPGDAFRRQTTIGPCAACRNETPNQLGLLRIGYSGADIQEPFQVDIDLADPGTKFQNLDLPVLMAAEAPMTVYVQPRAVLRASAEVVLSLVPVEGPVPTLYATRSIVAILGQVIPLPQWVRGVAILQNGTFEFRDRSATVLSAPLVGAHDRPAIAADIIMTAAGTITLYY